MKSTLNCKTGRTITAEQIGKCEYVEPPNNVDIEMAVCKLKNVKATGHDQIPAALINIPYAV
jgi:hypothetical protein